MEQKVERVDERKREKEREIPFDDSATPRMSIEPGDRFVWLATTNLPT
jgi:hypothetical protein